MSLLPPPPWTLQSGFTAKRTAGAVVSVLVGLAILGFAIPYILGGVFGMLAEQRLFDDPTAIPVLADVEGEVETQQFVFSSYDLEVTFEDRNGVVREVPLSFYTLFTGVDEDAPFLVRHAADDPTRIATSWSVGASTGRWLAYALMLALIALVGGAGLFLGAQWFRFAQAAKAAAAGGRELECTLLSVEPQIVNGQPNGSDIFRYRTPGAGVEKTEIVGKKEARPLLLDGGRTLLAIAPPDSESDPVVLREDLSPLVFDMGTREEIAQRMAARGGVDEAAPSRG